MGAGRGRQRRLWNASGGSPGGRFALDALPRRRPRYARYVEVLTGRTINGTEFRLYWVEECPRHWNAATASRYGVVVDNPDSFWVATARRLEPRASERDEGILGEALLARATYRSVRGSNGLREYQGRECVVYAVEQWRNDYGLHVPGRCGVRFVGDDSYWIVPAIELDIGPLASAS